MRTGILEAVRLKAVALWEEHGLLTEPVSIRARTLSVEEAIGNPEGEDFPIQKGKERLMEAEFRGARGQAFTELYGDFSGTLAELAGMPLRNNFRRALFVASLNATLSSLGRCEGAVHCRDKEPGECALLLSEHIRSRYGAPRITQVGYQPKFIQTLAPSFELRALDLDPENIGADRYGVRIEGPEQQAEALAWADLLLVTGSALVNDSLADFLGDKPVLLYGTSAAGAAALMGWDRFCAKST